MKIGVIVAMGKELTLLFPLFKTMREENTREGFTLYCGRIGNHDIAAMQCGIGKVNAALGTISMIESFKPDMVINTGVAGGCGDASSVLSIVVGERVAYHDVWCGPGTTPGEAADCPLYFRSSPAVMSLPTIENVDKGLICSGDIFISKAEEVEKIKAMFPDVKAVDMESAAIGQTCFLRGVDFFCMRVISDTPGAADNVAQYSDFWDAAPRATFSLLKEILHELK